jgi:hypothetical protein
MRNLSDLVKYRNELATVANSLNLHNAITKKINILKNVQSMNGIANRNIELINNNYKQLSIDNASNMRQIAELMQSINSEIDALALELFSGRELLVCTTRVNLLSDDLVGKLVKSKIKQYSDWHYPGLQISCNNKELIDCMVSADPLYLTNSAEDRAVDVVVSEIIVDYPIEYQNRLRVYAINGHNFSVLPAEQFSIIVCWDFLNYIEIDNIAQYMQQMFNLLRAGGVVMFSYNNCDIADSAKLAEDNAMSWANLRAIKQLSNTIGYDIIAFEDHQTEDMYARKHVSWVELRKPGILTTLKAHQVAGQILKK